MSAEDRSTTDVLQAVVKTGVARRRFLAGTGLAGAALLVAACGDDDDDEAGTNDTSSETIGTTADAAAGDAAIAAFAAGLEVLAVGTYKAALDAAVADKLGAVPAAGAEFVKTAMSHHQAHLDAWNEVLAGAGEAEVAAPDAGLKPTVDAEFAKVTDFAGAARLALMLEEIAAATYQSAIPDLQSKDAIKLAGSIQSIDAKHAAILHFVLGEYPVPDVFAKTDKAAEPA